MGCLIGKTGQHSPTPQKTRVNQDDQAIAQLKITRDKIRTYQKKLEASIQHCKNAVLQCIKQKQKDKAMLTLRKQKYMEKTFENSLGQLLQIEQLINDVESAQVQKNVYDALKQGNDLLKKFNEQLNIDDVERLMEDTREAIEYQNQISEALSQQGITDNQEDLLAELDQLDAEEALDVEIPDAPKHALPEAQAEQEKPKHKHKHKQQEVNYA